MFTTFETVTDLNKVINSISNRQKTLADSIQEAKNGCIQYLVSDSNVTPMADLLNAVGKGIRYGALKSLFEEAGVKVNKDKKTKKWRCKVGTVADLDRLQELFDARWEDFKHTDEVSDDEKAKSAFKNAVKWIEKYPELAKEVGLTFAKPEEEKKEEK